MTEFKSFWKNYVNFSDRTTRRGYWMAYLFLVIATIIVAIISALVHGAETMIGPIFFIWILAITIPSLAISIRRLRDAGKHWAWIFINLVPFIGSIWYLVLLCTPSVEDNGTPVV